MNSGTSTNRKIIQASQPKTRQPPVDTRFIAYLPLVFSLVLFSSCATAPRATVPHPGQKQPVKHTAGSVKNSRQISATQKLLIEEALRLIGVEKIFVKGKTFSHDCSGTVMAIYWYAGIDLSRNFANYTGGGTERIYKYLADKELLYKTNLPVPGDIIFWDNTYDKNKNGKVDDYLTHMGMVVAVDKNGTIEYIHENYRKGIILARMNLFNTGTYYTTLKGKKVVLNDPLRMRGSPKSSKWLSGQLYRNFGMGYLLK